MRLDLPPKAEVSMELWIVLKEGFDAWPLPSRRKVRKASRCMWQ